MPKYLLGNVPIDRVRIMGVINVSPESFYKNSVKVSSKEITETASEIEKQGVDFIDIGGMSTAPYVNTLVSQEKEIERIKLAIKAVRDESSLPISVDTPRAATAETALNLGATIVNDVTGLKFDSKMARIIHDNDASMILCAYEKNIVSGNVVNATIRALRKSIQIAKNANIRSNRIVIDPAIGFFRENGKHPFFTKMKGTNWVNRDLTLISKLKQLQSLRKPICVSVSRKSFLGKILNLENPSDRLIASTSAEAISVLNGANIIRTHNVHETVHAVRIAETLLKNSS
ncbi:MAG: dihydropteroate synthase [Nitrososphaerales archaeon]